MEILFLIFFGLIFTASFFFLKKNELSDDKFVIKNKYNLFFSISSFVSSALGFWIIFSPAAAATWGGMGNVIGYALGAAMPLVLFIFIGKYVLWNILKNPSTALTTGFRDFCHGE